MMKFFRVVVFLLMGWGGGLASGLAQRQLQDNFWLERQWTNAVNLGGVVAFGYGVTVSTNQRVYLATGSQVLVHNSEGAVLQTWSIPSVRDVALHPTSNLVLVCTAVTTSNQIKVLTPDGVLVRQWGVNGSDVGQLNRPQGIAVGTNGLIYVADTSNNRVVVFDDAGNFVRQWGRFGTAAGEFKSAGDVVASPDGTVYVADYSNFRVQRFDALGNFLSQYLLINGPPRLLAVAPDQLIYTGREAISVQRILSGDLEFLYNLNVGPLQYPDTTGVIPHAAAFSPDGQLLYVVMDRVTRVFRRGYRTMGLATPNALPLPVIAGVSQRSGETWVDVDFQVLDPDDATVDVAAIAFINGRRDLRAAIRMLTFTNGTDVAVPGPVPTGAPHRLTWDAATDYPTNFVNMKIDILAKDSRGLADFHFLTIPTNATYNSELRISRTPLMQEDLLGLWTWLVATVNPSVVLQTGDVYGVTGAYTGALLAQTQVAANQTNTITTANGRTFLFELLDVREATLDEVNRAKVATTPGVVSRWDPRVRIGDLPQKVNEYGFDTGLFNANPAVNVTNAWWVVPLN